MEIFITEQCKTLAESCIMGLIFGAGYDIIRILYVLCGIASCTGTERQRNSKTAFVLFLAGDLFYMLAVTIAASVFLYHVNHGQFRLYLALACIGGFCLYQYTIGRLVMRISEAIVRLLKRVVYRTVIRPVRWLFGLLFRGSRYVLLLAGGGVRRVIRYSTLVCRMRRRMRHFPAFVRFLP